MKFSKTGLKKIGRTEGERGESEWVDSNEGYNFLFQMREKLILITNFEASGFLHGEGGGNKFVSVLEKLHSDYKIRWKLVHRWGGGEEKKEGIIRGVIGYLKKLKRQNEFLVKLLNFFFSQVPHKIFS